MILWLLLFICQWQGIWNQRIEEQKCTQYKDEVFVTDQTFGYFIYGAEDIHVTVDDCESFQSLIIGGTAAKPKEFPMMARLGFLNDLKAASNVQWFCGGTLISEKFVLTAAHCFNSLTGVVNRVRLGELDFDSEEDDAKPQDFKVKATIPHPDYNSESESNYNDIGLVELATSVVFSRYIHPACLPTTNGDENKQVTAIGWGSTKFLKNTSSKQLLKVKLDRYDYQRCNDLVNQINSEKFPQGLKDSIQFCAGSSRSEDTCYGDSGGPLLNYHTYPCMLTITGITSAGLGDCGKPNVPAIYTRVYNYIDWIREKVWP